MLLTIACLLLAAVSAGSPAPAGARTLACAAKHGNAKRACVKRAANLRRKAARKKPKAKPPVVAPAPAPAPPADAPAPPPVVVSPAAVTGAITSWRAAGSAPRTDAAAAALVRSARETRPANAAANAYRPSAAEIDRFRNGQTDKYGRTALKYNRLTGYVTGAFSGTTDEILQWVAQKWGIPEDLVRAVAANESSWNMSQLGDRKTVTDAASYPAASRVGSTGDVYQSLGITQVRWTPQGLHTGTEPLRWKSTAFNADYWGSVVRYYFDGLCDWCGTGYAAGQGWSSIGAWYNPSPWSTGSQAYQDHVSQRLAARVWSLAGF
jgi:hypothetical protein